MKRLYTLLAMMSIINMAAVAVVFAYAWRQEWLTPDRVNQAVAALTGKDDGASENGAAVARAEDPPRRAEERIRRDEGREEWLRTELARRRREIEDGWALLEQQQLSFLQLREEFAEEKDRYQEAIEARAAAEGDSGRRKELDILAGLKPKDAMAQLQMKGDADVVRILMSMEARQARKIVAACKEPEERQWIGRILSKMHQRDAAQAEVLSANR